MILELFRAQRIGGQKGTTNLVLMLVMSTLSFLLSGCEVNEEAIGNQQSVGGPGGSPPAAPPPPGTPPPPSEPPPSATDQSLFAATLHPALVDAGNYCAGCHGVSQDPLIAATDITTAYNAITSQQKVNLSNPALSRIYLRPKDDRHNCNGDAECDRVADAFLLAIQDWSNQALSNVPPPTGGAQQVLSAAADLADVTAGELARVEDATIAKFEFAEGVGDTTMDTSGVGNPIVLQLQGTEWVDGGGLRIVSGKAEASAADSQKLFDMIMPTNEYTVEAWVIPDNNAQDGPARIVSYSQDTAVRNFTMGQNAIYYQLRNRSAGTGVNGTPELEALSPQVDTVLTHVAMTFDGVSGRKVYINGQLAAEENVADDTLDWLNDQLLVIGNETTNNRLWQGIVNFVGIHNRALNGAEIQQNFDAGVGETLTMHFDISNIVGEPAFIDMRFAQLDANGYLFARPLYVGDATGVAIKNIRVAVNGSVPVAAQPFRRIDTVALQSGQELSSLGAVVPVELGSDNDVFHLEFEVLAGMQGFAEMAVPSAPPLPIADSPEPDYGIRNFAQLNDAMSDLTGVDANQNAVLATYSEVRDSLPSTHDALAFGTSQQIAVQRLAASYCGVVVANNASCDAFFGNCAIDANGKTQVADALYDQIIGDNIAEQPDRADVTTEIVRMIDDLGCTNGCNGAEGELVLQSTCAAVLSSAAITVN